MVILFTLVLAAVGALAAPFQCTSGERTYCSMTIVPSDPLPTSSFNIDIELNYAFGQQIVRESPSHDCESDFFKIFDGSNGTMLAGGRASTSGLTGEALTDLITAWHGKDIPGDLVPFWHINSVSCSIDN